MHILPITNTYSYNKYSCSRKTGFTAKPDFLKYSTASCYFRRGAVLLSCAKGYDNIENLFCKIFQQNQNTPKNMLIVGIGNSQEPFSYLASIKGILKNNVLKENLDLFTVDLQEKPEHIKLKKDAFCDLFDYQSFPKYAENSFVKDSTENWLEIKHEDNLDPIEKNIETILSNHDKWIELKQQGYNVETIIETLNKEKKQESLRWRVSDEIFEFLEKTYNNPQKSKWDSRIQDIIKQYPDRKFDVISANNVIPYILSEREIERTMQNTERILKKGGYFITDPYNDTYHVREISKYKNLKKFEDGIFQKTE